MELWVNPNTKTTFSRQHSPKMVEYVFVLFVCHFWTRNRQILNFEHFELFFARFYSVKGAFSTKWWPGEENAPKIIFFAFLVYFYINTKYIKLDRNFENFLIFWCTLLSTGRCTPLSPVQLFLRWSLSMFLRCAIRLYRFPESTPKFGGIFHLL